MSHVIPPPTSITQSNPQQDITPRMMDTAAVAKYTGLSPAYFRCGRSAGNNPQPPHYRIGSRILYDRIEVDAWLNRFKVNPASAEVSHV